MFYNCSGYMQYTNLEVKELFVVADEEGPFVCLHEMGEITGKNGSESVVASALFRCILSYQPDIVLSIRSKY